MSALPVITLLLNDLVNVRLSKLLSILIVFDLAGEEAVRRFTARRL
jgi:hypothetical protein